MILVVFLSLIIILVAGWQKHAMGIPMCGTNRVAIAAACHYSDDCGLEASCKPLLWGVTKTAEMNSPGHCSISDKDVGKLVDGLTYE